MNPNRIKSIRRAYIIFSIIGIFTVAYIVIYIVKNIVHYLKFKEFSKNLIEQRLSLIIEENKKLVSSNSALEKENAQITLTILQRLNK